MAAAAQDENADASIGNITGSNSVNVFLGIGIPWVLATLYVKLYIKWFNRRLVYCVINYKNVSFTFLREAVTK